jgi:hypothetical protein
VKSEFLIKNISKMASLRNAVPQKTHKERHQPGKRQKLGFLEKHKDYVKRAQDYNKKQATIKKLEQKAAFRNPDEYYFKMVNTRKVVSNCHLLPTFDPPSRVDLTHFFSTTEWYSSKSQWRTSIHQR